VREAHDKDRLLDLTRKRKKPGLKVPDRSAENVHVFEVGEPAFLSFFEKRLFDMAALLFKGILPSAGPTLDSLIYLLCFHIFSRIGTLF
jgi:hypothetical protein